MDFNSFFKVSVATSLWGFIEMVKPQPWPWMRHVAQKRKEKKKNEVLRLNWKNYITLHKLLLCALPTVCWESHRSAGQGFPSNSTFHSSFCIRDLLLLFFSHLQDFTALKGVLKQKNHCYNLWPEVQSTSFHQSAEPVYINTSLVTTSNVRHVKRTNSSCILS